VRPDPAPRSRACAAEAMPLADPLGWGPSGSPSLLPGHPINPEPPNLVSRAIGQSSGQSVDGDPKEQSRYDHGHKPRRHDTNSSAGRGDRPHRSTSCSVRW
jgi:hypothetical protein